MFLVASLSSGRPEEGLLVVPEAGATGLLKVLEAGLLVEAGLIVELEEGLFDPCGLLVQREAGLLVTLEEALLAPREAGLVIELEEALLFPRGLVVPVEESLRIALDASVAGLLEPLEASLHVKAGLVVALEPVGCYRYCQDPRCPRGVNRRCH